MKLKSLLRLVPVAFFLVPLETVPANAATANDSILYVIHISVDGLRPDAVTILGPEKAPNFYRLRIEGAFTDNARTDFDFTNTIPNHTSQITSRPVVGENGHGITFNSDLGGTVHSWKGSYVGSAFDVAHDYGLSTGMYASKTKFSFFERSWDGSHGAPDTIGVDNGRSKIDFSPIDENTSSLIDKFINNMTLFAHNYSFVHLRDPDSAGHGRGWGSQGYLNSVMQVDGLLGRIFKLVDSDARFTGVTAIILSADHGGVGTNHQNNSDPNNYTIPFYAWGPGIPAGMDLYELNSGTRQDPGTGRPDYTTTPQPIRDGDVANLALDVLGLQAIPGSFIDFDQDLEIMLPGGADALPAVSFTSPMNGETFDGTSIMLEVTASANNGNVSLVEFFANYRKIAEVTASPYRFDWTNVSPGKYVITARAVDDAGAGNTASVAIEVPSPTSVARQKPDDFRLFGNYPNPFRHTTQIDFSLARGEQVKIKVYDILGREVGVAANGWFTSGRHAVRFDSRNLATGVYFYKLQVGQVTRLGRLQLIR